MSRFTRDLRQQIVRDFAEKNDGWFDPAAFLNHVKATGPEHPAFDWFQWDDDRAALEFRLDQARDFARGLVIRFEVQTIHRGAMRVVGTEMPLLQSPMESRRNGGGYYMSNPDDPEHVAELCRQAAQSLRWFVSRYHSAMLHAGVNLQSIEKVREALEHGGQPQIAAA